MNFNTEKLIEGFRRVVLTPAFSPSGGDATTGHGTGNDHNGHDERDEC